MESFKVKGKVDGKSFFAFRSVIQGVPQYCFHFVFVNFLGSRAHTEELFIARDADLERKLKELDIYGPGQDLWPLNFGP